MYIVYENGFERRGRYPDVAIHYKQVTRLMTHPCTELISYKQLSTDDADCKIINSLSEEREEISGLVSRLIGYTRILADSRLTIASATSNPE